MRRRCQQIVKEKKEKRRSLLRDIPVLLEGSVKNLPEDRRGVSLVLIEDALDEQLEVAGATLGADVGEVDVLLRAGDLTVAAGACSRAYRLLAGVGAAGCRLRRRAVGDVVGAGDAVYPGSWRRILAAGGLLLVVAARA